MKGWFQKLKRFLGVEGFGFGLILVILISSVLLYGGLLAVPILLLLTALQAL
jgi:hypothetical protein